MALIKDYFGDCNLPTKIKDPFTASCIERISLVMSTNSFTKEKEFDAYIKFKNGDTEGNQRIRGTDFSDLFNKTIAFCKTLRL